MGQRSMQTGKSSIMHKYSVIVTNIKVRLICTPEIKHANGAVSANGGENIRATSEGNVVYFLIMRNQLCNSLLLLKEIKMYEINKTS